jgi:ATP-dependent RNA helicase SUPV3L1/SUV3
VQLGADFERGHVFTDRMLNRRGREETLVLGAATARPMVEKLLRGANIVSRPRLSTLIHSGDKKLTRLPRRSAIVAFSADEVYAIAELIRRQHGGAAVVPGWLEPAYAQRTSRTYQSRDVDFSFDLPMQSVWAISTRSITLPFSTEFDGHQPAISAPRNSRRLPGVLAARRVTALSVRPGVVRRSRTSWQSVGKPFVERSRYCNGATPNLNSPPRCVTGTATPSEAGLSAPIAEDILVLEHAARDEKSAPWPRGRNRAVVGGLPSPDYQIAATHVELVATLYGF